MPCRKKARKKRNLTTRPNVSHPRKCQDIRRKHSRPNGSFHISLLSQSNIPWEHSIFNGCKCRDERLTSPWKRLRRNGLYRKGVFCNDRLSTTFEAFLLPRFARRESETFKTPLYSLRIQDCGVDEDTSCRIYQYPLLAGCKNCLL